jgi:hypothetical protein
VPKGEVVLQNAQVTLVEDAERPFCFGVRAAGQERMYLISAASADERQAWVAALAALGALVPADDKKAEPNLAPPVAAPAAAAAAAAAAAPVAEAPKQAPVDDPAAAPVEGASSPRAAPVHAAAAQQWCRRSWR